MDGDEARAFRAAFLDRHRDLIARYGCSITAVGSDPGRRGHHGYAYTAGLTAHHHPELLIAGLAPHVAHPLLDTLAARVHRDGERFGDRQRIDWLLAADLPVVLISGCPTGDLRPAVATALYGEAVRLLQVVYPDRVGLFPWQDGYALPPQVQPMLAPNDPELN